MFIKISFLDQKYLDEENTFLNCFFFFFFITEAFLYNSPNSQSLLNNLKDCILKFHLHIHKRTVYFEVTEYILH